MEPLRLRNMVCSFVATSVVLSYAYIGQPDSYPIVKNHTLPNQGGNILPEDYDHNSYYDLRSEEQRIREQVGIIHDFVSDLMDNSEDLDPRFSETVSKHFWDLA